MIPPGLVYRPGSGSAGRRAAAFTALGVGLHLLLAFEFMIVAWLVFYGALISRASQSRFGARLRHGLERATGVVLIELRLRLAVERR